MGQSRYRVGLRLFAFGFCLFVGLGLLVFPREQAQAQHGEQIHTVQPGETLGGIAAKYGVSYQQLARYNGISNPNLVRVGQRLRIPPSASAVTAPPRSSTAPVQTGVNPVQAPTPVPQSAAPVQRICHGELSYSVRSGDSLHRIAASYQVSIRALMARNNLPSTLIVVGQRLIIPSNC